MFNVVSEASLFRNQVARDRKMKDCVIAGYLPSRRVSCFFSQNELEAQIANQPDACDHMESSTSLIVATYF